MSRTHDIVENADRFAALLQEAVQKIKNEEDPIVLNEYKKIFKKNVPLTLRSYVAAYLAKNAVSGRHYEGRPRRERVGGRMSRRYGDNSMRQNDRFEERSEGTEERRSKRIPLEEGLTTTIFISAGRNRRVFPRDLLGLIASVSGLERERIGDIKVLDNYSFVQLYIEDADKVIASLNQYNFRGRPLTVSYSRKKEEGFGEEGILPMDSIEEENNTDYLV